MKPSYFFLGLPLAGARVVPQVPIVGHVKEVGKVIAQEADASTIGVHFTTSYAVAAARYQDGTTRDLVRVAADADYIELMSRWTQWENDLEHQDCRVHVPHLTISQAMLRRIRCNMRFLERSSRQILGLPASRDVAVLSDFIRTVCSAIEAEIDAPVATIAPAFPRLSPGVQEDVEEALSFAGLSSTRINTGHGDSIVYEEANAAYAAHGHGLCEEWSFKSDCLSAQWPAKHQSVVYFNFDNSSFSVGAMSIQNAFQEQATYQYGIDTKLGWWNLPVYETPRADFWARVHEMILDVLAPMPMPPNRIILFGEHGADAEFEEVVKDAMWDKFEAFDVELMLSSTTKKGVGMLAARGAAELAWRDEEMKRHFDAYRQTNEEVPEL